MTRVGRIFLVICALLTLVTSVLAQETSALYGRVVPEGTEFPPDWLVRVTAKRSDTDETLDVRNSSRELYCVTVPLAARVVLYFETSFPYGSQRTNSPIDTSRSDRGTYRLLPDVVLSQTSQRTGANARHDAQRDLNMEIESARATGSIDILQQKLESYRSIYQGEPEIMADIDQAESGIKTNHQLHNLAPPEFEQRMNLLRNIDKRLNGKPAEVSASELLSLIQSKAVFPGIRKKAVVALSMDFKPDPSENSDAQRALTILRTQASNPLSELFIPSLTALAKIGTDEDKQMVIQGIRSSDPDRAIGSIVAAGEARLGSAIVALVEVVRGESSSMLVELSIQSLASFGQIQDKAAIAVLKERLLQDKAPSIRAGAAEALGTVVGTNPEVRKAMEEVKKKDVSPQVREAAASSLRKRRP
jgi:hypothetical protein